MVSMGRLTDAVAAQVGLGDPLTVQAVPLLAAEVVHGSGQLLACAAVEAELLLLPQRLGRVGEAAVLDFSPEELVGETVALAARYLAGWEEGAEAAMPGMSEMTRFR